MAVRIAAPGNQQIAESAFQDAITLLAHRSGILPLDRGHDLSVITVSEQPTPDCGLELSYQLAKMGFRNTLTSFCNTSCPKDIDRAVAHLDSADALIVGIYLRVRAWKGEHALSPAMLEFLAELDQLPLPVILIAFGDPYILADLPETEAVLAAYSGTYLAERAVARAIAGKAGISGRLGVSLPGRYEFGHAIELPAKD